MVVATDIDKSGWEIGEWTTEPDVIKWVDKATSLPCLITRHPELGHLCGYVGVTDSHPWFGDSYQNHYDIEVHGDLTFSEYLSEESSNIWWFGFDCGHGDTHGDKSPGPFRLQYEFLGFRPFGTYRNIEFVEDQIEKLASQIKENDGKQTNPGRITQGG
jgi:hypothetical protein